MNSQRGITITGFLVFAVLLISALLLGFKIGPAYMEYSTIQKIFRAMANEPSLKNATRGEFNSAFNARAGVDNIKAITYDDVQIEKDGDGILLSAEYSVRVPLFGNLSALMEFRPTSKP
ncbi:MAG: DUF4845 domain-containing protein [Burkholderiales bacterium]|nr:DUF4845 domain-containing protein [Rubrivivax sp.]MDP2397465.1 DUF4845 domain-containing protein [Burkholderiales bacterium]